VRGILGEDYGATVGSELGRLVAILAPWAIASVGVSVAFPLVFVVERARALPLIAVVALLAQVPLALLGQSLGGLDGLELALAATTLGILVALLAVLDAVRVAARGLAIAALTVAVVALVAFVPPAFLFSRVGAALCGLLLYAALLAAIRPRGLRVAWRYLHQLG